MTASDGEWHLGIGDPTPIGWFTVAAYLLAAWACWLAYAASDGDRRANRAGKLWLWLLIALTLLGINKQLDLQTALTEIGREISRQLGWYERRHLIQIAFISSLGVAGALTLLWIGRRSFPMTMGRAFALAGLAFLVGFVFIRAASFHHVDVFLDRTALGLRWNWILELSGIGLVAVGAILERTTRRSRS
jgi:hypothetical protein